VPREISSSKSPALGLFVIAVFGWLKQDVGTRKAVVAGGYATEDILYKISWRTMTLRKIH
jgi:hypothetical protein